MASLPIVPVIKMNKRKRGIFGLKRNTTLFEEQMFKKDHLSKEKKYLYSRKFVSA
jgi:hypothetical protein